MTIKSLTAPNVEVALLSITCAWIAWKLKDIFFLLQCFILCIIAYYSSKTTIGHVLVPMTLANVSTKCNDDNNTFSYFYLMIQCCFSISFFQVLCHAISTGRHKQISIISTIVIGYNICFTITTSSSSTTLILLVVLLHWIIHRYGICNNSILSDSFTPAEALILSQALTLYSLDLFLQLMMIVAPNADVNYIFISPPERSELHRALQGGLLGTIFTITVIFSTTSPKSSSYQRFYIVLVLVLSVLVVPLVQVLMHQNPITFVLEFITLSRMLILLYWATCIITSIAFVFPLVQKTLEQIVARKLYHALVVILFLPVTLVDAEFMFLSYGIALALFLLIECIRILKIYPLGPVVQDFMQQYVDSRDSGTVIKTHIYLLLGCALPLWLSNTSNVQNAAGINVLGVADAMGALVGTRAGRHLVFNSRSKTFEGSISFFISMILFNASVFHSFSNIGGIILVTLMEASTNEIDNLILPLYYVSVIS